MCRSCSNNLAHDDMQNNDLKHGEARQAADYTYRASLLGVAPRLELLGKTTAQEFRAFVEDMDRVLTGKLNLLSNCTRVAAVSFSRQDILQIVALLIRNAAPCSDPRIRRKREARNLVLWTAIFKMIPAWFGGPALQDSIRRWPMALRRRFASALRHRSRRRWPYSPWGPIHDPGIRFKYMELARVYDLSKPTPFAEIFRVPRDTEAFESQP
jgi:hypothetical protein